VLRAGVEALIATPWSGTTIRVAMSRAEECQPGSAEWVRRDAERNERARNERLRRDGQRPPGENILEADQLIRFAFRFAGAAARGSSADR